MNDVELEEEFARNLSLNTDEDELYAEIERLEAAKKKEESKKKKLLQQIISLDPDDEMYDTLYEDLSGCLQEFTRNVAVIDANIAKTTQRDTG